MRKESGWLRVKETAKINGISYSTYVYRIYSGQTPEEAASIQTKEIERKPKTIPPVREEYKYNVPVPKTRVEALQQIDKIIGSECDPCEIRIAMTLRNKNNSSPLEKICNVQCPVGKQIQDLSEYLQVAPRKSVKGGWT
ncbi:zinc-finger domain-containing protein [Paenibacillus sp. 11B]|uniref:zinc-finger domain-containing protein n=1 Tax=unclassified Paenibacillus TaxID=185978 RepID=UPI002653E22D|nr:zinc-finger domain-containing protein [Paenibacillus sp. 11B]MDN8590961.1 zinc-finger domain-containing protein [Paenibacillus sp. 11B]